MSSNRSPSGSSISSASAAPWQDTNTPSSGSTDFRPAAISARKPLKNCSSTGPPGCACATRMGTGVQGPEASIAVKKPGRSGRVIEAAERLSVMIRLPRISTSSSKSCAVATGEKRLHSMAKPSTAIRGFSFDTAFSLPVAGEEGLHQFVERSGVIEVWRVSRVGKHLRFAVRKLRRDRRRQERREHRIVGSRDQQRGYGKHCQVRQSSRRRAPQACAQRFLLERARHLVDAAIKKM